MPLNNSQKSKVIRIAKENGYTGNYNELFNQADKDDIFQSKDTSQIKNEGFSSAHNLTLDSLLEDNTPHTFSNIDTFMTSDHNVKPNPKAIVDFLKKSDFFFTLSPN